MISKKHKFIFAHIPKTAGNAIHNVLVDYSECSLKCNIMGKSTPREDNYLNDFGLEYTLGNLGGLIKHSGLKQYYKLWDESIYGSIDDYLKFTVVRNPWDRAISLYFYMMHVRNSPKERRSCYKDRQPVDKRKFKTIMSRPCGTPQFNFINVPSRGVKADVILKFESLQKDFDLLCPKIGVPCIKLPKVNVGRQKHYTKYYDDEMNEFILNKYAKDIAYFNYEFGK